MSRHSPAWTTSSRRSSRARATQAHREPCAFGTLDLPVRAPQPPEYPRGSAPWTGRAHRSPRLVPVPTAHHLIARDAFSGGRSPFSHPSFVGYKNEAYDPKLISI